MGFQELLGVNPFDAAFTLLNTIVLFLVLKKFLFKPVEKVMEQCQAEVDNIYGEAESAKADAEAYKAAYDEKLARRHMRRPAMAPYGRDIWNCLLMRTAVP